MRAIYLLIGFLCMFQFPIPKTDITFFPLLGFLLMLYSVLRMEKMEPAFKKAKVALIVAIPISAALFGLQIFSTVGKSGAWFSYTYAAIRILTEIAEIVTAVFLYIGIKIIGSNAEIPSLEKQSIRCMSFMAVYVFVYTAINLLNLFRPEVFSGYEFVTVWPFVIGYIWRALTVWMAFTLHTKISVSHN